MRSRQAAALVFFMMLAADRAYGASAEPVCSTPAAIFCDDFETETLPGIWQDGYIPSQHRITTDPTNVYSGTHALEVLYPGGDGGWLTRWFMPGYDHVFARLYFKIEAGWQCGAVGCTKIMALYGNRHDNQWSGFGQAGICPKGTDYYYAGVIAIPPTPGEFIFYTYYPEMPCPGGSAFGQHFHFTPQLTIQDGAWTCIELEVLANTPGLHDGLQRVWINGALKSEVLNMRWRDTTELQTNALQLTFSTSGSLPKTQHAWVDNIVVSTQRVGCLSASIPTAPSGLTVR